MNQLEQLIRSAVANQQQGRFPEAEAQFRQVLQADPGNPLALHHLGLIAHLSKHPDVAIQLLSKSIEIAPKQLRFRTNFATILMELGQDAMAEQQLRAALEIAPKDLDALGRMGTLLEKHNRQDEAAALYRKAVDMQADSVELCAAAGNALGKLGALDDAIACLRHAVALQNSNAEAHNNLGLAYAALGETEKAVTSLQRGVDYAPNNSRFHQNLLYYSHFHPDYEAPAIFADHRRWARTHADPLVGKMPARNARSADRPLRVGYIATSFKSPRVTQTIMPLVMAHDPKVEVVCYTQDDSDYVEGSHHPLWRPTKTFSDLELAQLFQYDKIDILVDLSLHEPGSRMLALARKSVPILIAYAYPGTSGTGAFDYRFTEARLDTTEEKLYSEKSIALPTYWSFDAAKYSPATSGDTITLVALGDLAAMNDHVVDTWADIMVALPEARLLVPNMNASGQKRVMERLSRRDIGAARVVTGSLNERLANATLALDVFPFSDATGALAALAMNVPVVTMSGATAVSRSTASILELLGMRDAIVKTPGEYAKRAVAMVESSTKTNVREKLLQSPVCDVQAFTRNVEKIYRDLWTKWCSQGN